MVLVSVGSETGAIGQVNASRNDLVAEVKARLIEECFPEARGRMVSLTYNGHEMEDDSSVGDYGVHDLSAARFFFAIPANQPYAPVDYAKLSKALIAEGRKRPAADFFQPGDAWEGRWTHGDEYLNYPPVDVNNRWSTVPPSSSRELAQSPAVRSASRSSTGSGSKARPNRPAPTLHQRSQPGQRGQQQRPPASHREQLDQEGAGDAKTVTKYNGLYQHIPERIRRVHEEREQKERENLFRRARQGTVGSDEATTSSGSQQGDDAAAAAAASAAAAGGGVPVGRTFLSLYTCRVGGCDFGLIHKAEGKWAGMAGFFTSNLESHPAGTHACSSRVAFLPDRGCWVERQRLTGASGVSSHSTFYYVPQADKLAHVDTDLPELTQIAVTKLREVGAHVLVLTATHAATGQPLLSETITFSADFQSRVRTGQRFDISGQLKGSYISRERKFIDEDSGAIEPFFA